MKRNGKRTLLDWKAVLGIVISIALLWWAFHDIDFREVMAEIRLADPWLYLLSLVLATGLFWIRAWRWGPLVKPLAGETKFHSRLSATMIGFMGNNVLPARIGEFARAYAFSRMERASVVGAFGSLVLERLFDGIAVVALLFIATLLPSFPDVTEIGGRDLSGLVSGVTVLIGALIAACFALILFPRRTVNLFENTIARVLPRPFRRPIVDGLEALLASLGALRSPAIVALVSFQTLVLWLFNALGFYVALLAFGIDVPFSAALFLQSAIALGVSVPSGPGFFGPWEIAAKAVLVGMFAVTESKALAFATAFHIGGYIPVTVIGLWFAYRLGISLKDVEKSETAVEEAVEAEAHPADRD